MCENCMHLEFDEETREYICMAGPVMDEDDFARISYQSHKQCPFYRVGDEYTLVRKQN